MLDVMNDLCWFDMSHLHASLAHAWGYDATWRDVVLMTLIVYVEVSAVVVHHEDMTGRVQDG